MLYARRGRLPKGVKSPQPKADRKGQSQTVQTLRVQHPLKYLLHIANLPKSSFYYHHQDRPDPDAADKALLVETYRRHKGRYGQRRIAAALDWNRKKAARLMKQLELKALIRAKKAYRHPAMGEISEHLLKRRFKARKPNEKWLTDVTELKGSDGKLYLSPILDLFNREIVAYAMSRNANSEMVKEMLEKAAPRLTDKGTMLHSDQGVPYRTAGYRELLAQHSMLQSMSRKAKSSWITAKSSTNTPK
ncbi:IS3 family transposase [Neisseria sicca]